MQELSAKLSKGRPLWKRDLLIRLP